MPSSPARTPLGAFRIPDGKSFKDVKYVEIVDQLLLPHTVRWEKVSNVTEAFDAIKTMKIRGAPAIASLAALGIASELLASLEGQSTPCFPKTSLSSTSELLKALLVSSAYLLKSRPTAVNLQEALNRIEAAGRTAEQDGASVKGFSQKVIQVCIKVWTEDKERCETIGRCGSEWILEKLEREGRIPVGGKINVLTVCNTGSLATSGYGTALGVITSLQQQGRLEHAYYAQTGPYQQGARLTSMELASIGAKNTMVCDTAIGALIAEKTIHLFVAGADRIAANGDTANKISTFQISLLCSAPHPFSPNPPIPVLVAAPVATLDLEMSSGRSIVIEQRPSWEACTVRGRVVDVTAMAKSGGHMEIEREDEQTEKPVATVLITPPNTLAWNPAFDVTPASLIAGIVTEVGVAEKVGLEYDLRSFVKSRTK